MLYQDKQKLTTDVHRLEYEAAPIDGVQNTCFDSWMAYLHKETYFQLYKVLLILILVFCLTRIGSAF